MDYAIAAHTCTTIMVTTISKNVILLSTLNIVTGLNFVHFIIVSSLREPVVL